jgi:hypothetical protein
MEIHFEHFNINECEPLGNELNMVEINAPDPGPFNILVVMESIKSTRNCLHPNRVKLWKAITIY